MQSDVRASRKEDSEARQHTAFIRYVVMKEEKE